MHALGVVVVQLCLNCWTEVIKQTITVQLWCRTTRLQVCCGPCGQLSWKIKVTKYYNFIQLDLQSVASSNASW